MHESTTSQLFLSVRNKINVNSSLRLCVHVLCCVCVCARITGLNQTTVLQVQFPLQQVMEDCSFGRGNLCK